MAALGVLLVSARRRGRPDAGQSFWGETTVPADSLGSRDTYWGPVSSHPDSQAAYFGDRARPGWETAVMVPYWVVGIPFRVVYLRRGPDRHRDGQAGPVRCRGGVSRPAGTVGNLHHADGRHRRQRRVHAGGGNHATPFSGAGQPVLHEGINVHPASRRNRRRHPVPPGSGMDAPDRRRRGEGQPDPVLRPGFRFVQRKPLLLPATDVVGRLRAGPRPGRQDRARVQELLLAGRSPRTTVPDRPVARPGSPGRDSLRLSRRVERLDHAAGLRAQQRRPVGAARAAAASRTWASRSSPTATAAASST